MSFRMPIKAPSFWFRGAHERRALLEILLDPCSFLYAAGRKIDLLRKSTHLSSLPVICVGNVVVGGTGKTPTVRSLTYLIKKHDLAFNPCILTRGYGGTQKAPLLVDPLAHDSKQVGDEPLLLAQDISVFVSSNRPEGAKAAATMGYDLVIMDDGFQNPSLFKDICLLVIDGEMGFGNGKLLPSGPLRETISDAFKRTHAVIMIGSDLHKLRAIIPPHIPVFETEILPSDNRFDQNSSYTAFCGIGNPAKFQKMLQNNQYNITDFYSYPDHYVYTHADLAFLENKAAQSNSRLITTEKDFFRLPLSFRENVDVFKIQLQWKDEDLFVSFIKNSLQTCARYIAKNR